MIFLSLASGGQPNNLPACAKFASWCVSCRAWKYCAACLVLWLACENVQYYVKNDVHLLAAANNLKNRFKGPSSMFPKLVDGACNQNVYEGSSAACDFSITQARHRNWFTAQRRVSTDSKLMPQMSMHRQSKKQATISAPRHCYAENENPSSDGPRFFRRAYDNLRKHVLPTPLNSQCQTSVQDDGSRILMGSVTQYNNVGQPAICGATFPSFFWVVAAAQKCMSHWRWTCYLRCLE